MKKIDEMNVKELREVAKEMNISGRWDMTKAQLIEAVKAETAKAEVTKKVEATKKNENKKSNAVKIQREFVEVAESRKEIYRYISITVNGLNMKEAINYVDAIVAKMNEMYGFVGEVGTFASLGCPDFDEKEMRYTDMISFEKHAGCISEQYSYVGKLMTKAMKALKK